MGVMMRGTALGAAGYFFGTYSDYPAQYGITKRSGSMWGTWGGICGSSTAIADGDVIVASVAGTSPVTLTLSVNGVQICNATDSSSPLTGGIGPGLWFDTGAGQGIFSALTVTHP